MNYSERPVFQISAALEDNSAQAYEENHLHTLCDQLVGFSQLFAISW